MLRSYVSLSRCWEGMNNIVVTLELSIKFKGLIFSCVLNYLHFRLLRLQYTINNLDLFNESNRIEWMNV